MKISIRNFQSLGKVDLDVEGLTVLVGASHRGKSALIRAVEGALFNKPGNYFVRNGTKEADVTLSSVPDATGGTHWVHWVKGISGGAKYWVDNEPYSKVGTSTP